jgi:GTP cyclohydrolase III
MRVYDILKENVNDRRLVNSVAAKINKSGSKCKATLSVTGGDTKLAVTSDSKQIPACVRDVLKQMEVGMGAKTATEHKDGSYTLEFFITRF